MASAAGASKFARARIGPEGRLVEADSLILMLQEQAGAALGERLVLPQLAAIAELARQLGIPVTRPAIVAGNDVDLDLWVHAKPQDEDVVLTIERSVQRPASRSRLELAAREEDRLASAHGEWSADEELRFTVVAPDVASLIGAEADELVGEPLTKWIRLIEDDDGSMPMLVAVSSRSDFSGQQAVARNANAGKLLLDGHPVLGPGEEFLGFRGIVRPVGANHPAAANEGSASGIDPLLDDALRSPIVRIIAAAEGIASRSEGPLRNDYAVYAGDIATAARHLASVIRSMVDQPADPVATIDAVRLADEAIGLVEPQAAEKQIHVERTGIAWLEALGDERSVVQILVNLLGNAVRHAPQGSVVQVRLDKGTTFGCLTVVDQGDGVAQEDQERIFGRFERGAEGGGSSGLGLAIARRLARTMGGDISLVSAPGEGAQFTLSLPLAP